MPEIWLNYGVTEIVLDIRAENLDQQIESGGDALKDDELHEKLAGLDLASPLELAVLHNSKSVQKVLSSLFMLCEQKSIQFPKLLADRQILDQVRAGLPEGCTVSEFADSELSNSRLVFLGEMEFDGLFGYETVSTRLLRRFGQESMLAAYAKRRSNVPAPGQTSESFQEARKFVDNFEIQSIEIVSGSSGIVDLAVGHPSATSSITKSLESFAVKDTDPLKSVIISTGKTSSNSNLASSLSSLWNCAAAVKKDGVAILVAECGDGLGSDSFQQYVEDRLTVEQLRNPPKYIQGMEGLLYLHEIQSRFQIGLVSILPEFYTKKLGMISLSGITPSLEYIIKTQGPRQKVAVVSDGSRLLLR